MALTPDEARALAELLEELAGVDLAEVKQLTGGASRETFELLVASGSGMRSRYILQREVGEMRRDGGLAQEAQLVAAAGRAGVPTPAVLAANGHATEVGALGASYMISCAISGETIARRILRDPSFDKARLALPAQLGRALGLLHTKVDPNAVSWLEATDQLDHYRTIADDLGIISPTFELGFAWLTDHRPRKADRTVVHGDFRLGNLIVNDEGLAAVIDWELAHLGDPMEDLGWLCVRAWRFGGSKPVAGIGEREQLFAAYAETTGEPVDPAVVLWWEVMGTLKWGIMCAIQAERHLHGGERSVELAAIGPRLAEQEYDLIGLIKPEMNPEINPEIDSGAVSDKATHQEFERTLSPGVNGIARSTGAGEGGGRPTADDLIGAAEEFLRSELADSEDERLGFHAKVAANALAIARRDLLMGPAAHANNQSDLATLGHNSESSLANAIRLGSAGPGSDDSARVWDYCYSSVVRRLQINNPRWLQ